MARELNEKDREVIAHYVEEVAIACERRRPFVFGWEAHYSEPRPQDDGPIIELSLYALVSVKGPLIEQYPLWRITTLLTMFDENEHFGGHYQLTPRGGLLVVFGHIMGRRTVLNLQSKTVLSIDFANKTVERVAPNLTLAFFE